MKVFLLSCKFYFFSKYKRIETKKINSSIFSNYLFSEQNQWFFPYLSFLNSLELSNSFWKYNLTGGGVGIFFGVESSLFFIVWLIERERFHLDCVKVILSWLFEKASLSSGFFYNNWKRYIKRFIRSPERVFELEASLISPIVGSRVSTLIVGNVEIPARAITDIVHKLICRIFMVWERMLSICVFGENKSLFIGRLELWELMYAILA